MIDIHTHILAGLDDGAPDLETSVAMARLAAEAGTTDLVAAPHSNLEYHFSESLVEERLAELRQAAGGAVRIHRGCDFHLHFDNIQDALAHPARYTINQKRYLLVEFSDLVIFNSTQEVFGRFLDAGLCPVVTHPERNPLLQQRLDRLAAWVEQGCSVQVTAQSLLGRFGRRARDFARDLIQRRLAHFVASDAHDCTARPPRLDQAYAWVARQHGAAMAERLFVTNPQAALDGAPLEPLDQIPSNKPAFWHRLWR